MTKVSINRKRQNGVALVVGLVMLLVLTIMGISSMSTTTQELKVACNFQTHNDAFQGAMTCVNQAIAGVKIGEPFPQDFECKIDGNNAVAKGKVDYLGCQQVQGSSLKFAGYENVYDIDTESTSLGCGGEAFSHIVQAIGIRTAATSCAD